MQLFWPQKGIRRFCTVVYGTFKTWLDGLRVVFFVLEEEQGGCAILVKRNSSLNYTACLQRNLVANMRETKIYIREY